MCATVISPGEGITVRGQMSYIRARRGPAGGGRSSTMRRRLTSFWFNSISGRRLWRCFAGCKRVDVTRAQPAAAQRISAYQSPSDIEQILFISEWSRRKKTDKKQYTINTKIQAICKIIMRSLVCSLQKTVNNALRLQKQKMLQGVQGKIA